MKIIKEKRQQISRQNKKNNQRRRRRRSTSRRSSKGEEGEEELTVAVVEEVKERLIRLCSDHYVTTGNFIGEKGPLFSLSFSLATGCK